MSFQWQHLECLEGITIMCLQNTRTSLSQKRGIVLLRPLRLLHWTLQIKQWFPEQLSVQNCLPRLLQHQPQCLIEAISVENQKGCQYFLILCRSCSLPGRPLVLHHSLGHSWATWQGQQLMGWLQLLRSGPHLLCWMGLWPGLEGMLHTLTSMVE